MIQPATYCGDFSSTRTVLVGYIATEGQGYMVRAVNLCLASDYHSGQTNSWSIQLGKQQPTGNFTCLFERQIGSGMRADGTRWLVSPGFRVQPGDVVALRAVASGAPATIHGLSVALEYGILGSR